MQGALLMERAFFILAGSSPRDQTDRAMQIGHGVGRTASRLSVAIDQAVFGPNMITSIPARHSPTPA